MYYVCIWNTHLYVYVLNTYNTYILIQYTCTLSGKNVKALLFVNINISDFNKIHACVDPGKTGKHFGFAGEEVNRGLGWRVRGMGSLQRTIIVSVLRCPEHHLQQ